MIWPFKKNKTRVVKINISRNLNDPMWITGEVETDGLGREYVEWARSSVFFLKDYPSTHIIYVNYTPKGC